ncbi:eukaryotic membrane protein family protein [Sarocladium implicatum]|nr:eukaryotic membrane protein family protein [Sarocladium implicatum]
MQVPASPLTLSGIITSQPTTTTRQSVSHLLHVAASSSSPDKLHCEPSSRWIIQDAARLDLMAPSADPGDNPPLSSPVLTPTTPTKPSLQPLDTGAPLATIPSDEDRSSEDGSFRSSPGRPARSNSSSISDATPDVDDDAWDQGQATPAATQTEHREEPATVTNSRSRSSSSATNKKSVNGDGIERLSAADMKELANSPESLPIAPAPARRSIDQEYASRTSESREAIRLSMLRHPEIQRPDMHPPNGVTREARSPGGMRDATRRPSPAPRTVSTPPTSRSQASEAFPGMPSPRRYSFQPSPHLAPLQLHVGFDGAAGTTAPSPAPWTTPSSIPTQPAHTPLPRPPSPIPPMIPLPPMSLPTHLQLELAAQRPSPLYIHQSHTNDIPYESSAVKFERLKNVLLLPSYLERTLYFGALACLDAWLYTFTILPVRFLMALWILVKWWAYVVGKEARWVCGFVWQGIGRLWERERGRGGERSRRPSELSEPMRSRSRSGVSDTAVDMDIAITNPAERQQFLRRASQTSQPGNGRIKSPPMPSHNPGPKTGTFRHRRTKSMPSSLSAYHKADLLQGCVILCSSIALMSLDASRMYHFIRAQSAIKLYVIYNILEVGDRLLSALGQDILECLFSSETLSRNASGRSKILLPLGMFLLALAYNCLHSIALYYQVITLNVAVNSYSNALLTLLLSNQFVEIKSTVFKRFEKDNLFQLTCADIVERFQLWIMLLIIGMRNVVEVGGLSVPGAGLDLGSDEAGPRHTSSSMPASFTMIPSWLMSGEVLSPFLIVVGSEMLVDTIKHAYVTKFNNIKPAFYSRILDILCKDYYTNAFSAPSLTRRLGLAVIPLSCLFIRASVQTYHMFLSTHVPMPVPQTTQTSLSDPSATPSSPAVLAALTRFDSLIRDSLGRATYGYPYGSPLNSRPWYSWTSDDFVATLTMVVVFFIVFLVLLILKLLLGMILLKYARNRYAKMRTHDQAVARGTLERESYESSGRRVGGFGHIEVGEERQRWIHADKNEGLRDAKGIGGKKGGGDGEKKQEGEYHGVSRYEMVAKRIW